MKNFTASSRGISLRVTFGPGRQLFHALLDGREVFRGERTLVGEVVVEAVLDHRADGDLGVREQLLHGLGQEVRRGMAHHLQAFRDRVGDDLSGAS